MTDQPAHKKLVVRLAASDEKTPTYRIRKTESRICQFGAWFAESPDTFMPIQAEDGTFEIHVPRGCVIPGLRIILRDEGIAILREEIIPGDGHTPNYYEAP